jgi:hypothetical protein
MVQKIKLKVIAVVKVRNLRLLKEQQSYRSGNDDPGQPDSVVARGGQSSSSGETIL